MGRDWQKAYEAGETPWDKGSPAPPLRDFLERHPVSGRVLVPGCGFGHDVRALAGQGADVTGLDLAGSAVSGAMRFPKAGGERYLEADFLSLPATWKGSFDWVVEHTLLCAIEPEDRPAYARSVEEVLAPDGRFFGIFFRVVPDDDGKGPPYALSGEEIDALFDADFEVLESWIPSSGYPSRPPGSEEVRLMRRRSN